MRESWTDERLDDFRGETARRFDTLERRMDTFERRVESGFGELRSEMNSRFEAMQRTMIQLWATSILTTIAAFGTLLATQL